jgi:hypothetical protein
MEMKQVTQHLKSIGVLIFVMVLAAAMIPVPKATQAQAAGTAPVTVVNTPLPISLTGTGNISGDVNATQSGAWNVGVTNLPAVQLASGATVGISGFSNTEGTALFTSDVDAAARRPFALELCSSLDSNLCAPTPFSATLPVGERFVIEQVSGGCSDVRAAAIFASLNGVLYRHSFPVIGSTSNFSQLTRIYVDGGVLAGLRVQPPSMGTCSMTLSGHLVSIASPFPTVQ